MKFKLKRETLLKPLQTVFGVVERRQTLPILANVLLQVEPDRLVLTATDMEVELVADVEADLGKVSGAVTLPARKLLDICKTLPDDAMLQVEVGDGKAVVRSGRSRFSLATLPAEDYPALDDIRPTTRFEVPQNVFRNLINRTQFAMAQQDVRYYLNGLLLEISDARLRAVATDGHRLALCDAEVALSLDQDAPAQIIIPRKGVIELGRLLENDETPAGIAVSGNHIQVQVPGLRFTCKLIDGRFPDYDRVLPEAAGGDALYADREVLRHGLARTSILFNEKYRGIRLTLAPGQLRALAHNPEQEEAEEEIEVEYDGGEMEIGFNVSYLLDAISAIETERVRINFFDSSTSCLVLPDGSTSCQYVVMPMRL